MHACIRRVRGARDAAREEARAATAAMPGIAGAGATCPAHACAAWQRAAGTRFDDAPSSVHLLPLSAADACTGRRGARVDPPQAGRALKLRVPAQCPPAAPGTRALSGIGAQRVGIGDGCAGGGSALAGGRGRRLLHGTAGGEGGEEAGEAVCAARRFAGPNCARGVPPALEWARGGRGVPPACMQVQAGVVPLTLLPPLERLWLNCPSHTLCLVGPQAAGAGYRALSSLPSPPI